MKSSMTHAAKRPKINSSIAKKYGTPQDVSACTGGDIYGKTQASARPAVNSNIAGKHFFEGPNDWGRGV